MKRTQKGLSLSALLCSLLLGACASEAPWSSDSDTDGKIALRLATESNVVRPTRADDEHCSVIPGADEFSISLNGKSGSYSKTWSSSDAFNREGGFPMGTYTLSATFGDIESEGFSSPCFRGETDVTVEAGKESSSTVIATLANAMVSIRYTDKFMAMFPQYTALLTSEGHNDPVVFVKQETRPAFVSPRPVHVSLKLMNQQGYEKTVGAADFEAKPQHHHVITFDVQEEVGVSALNVIFEENVTAETNEIYLTDELFTTPAPQVSLNEDAKGGVSAFEYLPLSGKSPEMHVSAFGGIKSAVLTCVASDGGEAPFATLDLMKETDRAILDQYGIKASGFIAKKDDKGQDILNKMAVVGFAHLPKSHAELPQALKPGKYAFKLTVGDGSNIEVDPTEAAAVPELVINVTELKFTAEESATPKFLSGKVEVTVSSNCPSIADIVALSLDGKAAKILNSSKVEPSSSDMPYKYAYTLEYPGGKIEDSKCTFKAEVGVRTPIERTIDVDMPNYTVDVDAFAKKVLMRVNCDDAAMLKEIVRRLNISNEKQSVAVPDNTTGNENSVIIEISGLQPSTPYNVSLGSNKIAVAQFTTESAEGVPNGDFEDLKETINLTINQGGKWTNRDLKSAPRYQTTLTMNIKEPDKWVSTNQITCDQSSSSINSWYVIPSVYNTTLTWSSHQPEAKVGIIGQSKYDSTADVYRLYSKKHGENAMVIRNVAWDKNGSAISDDQKTGEVTPYNNYYCSNQPQKIANRTAGRMWLGSADKEGVEFKSRPSVLKGYYQYIKDANDKDENDSNEKGVVKVEVLSGDKVIGDGSLELDACSGYEVFSVDLTYYSNELFKLKPTKLKISLSSSNKTSDIKTTNYCNKDECCSRGAMLVVDNLTFEY
ncbi:MAG: DUF4493 domain-containing protein [Muribaculaceae bacterium]|nr:DUF4493 domain-containing protein [Muribaculaceae bacterium]MDE6754289.1 DUF4493 domain-containing protein [Muribaculaceae bacterium]